MTTKTPLTRPVRLLIGALRVAMIAAAVVIGGTQIALTTPLLRRLLNGASPDHFHLEYQSAWSIWPGTVHVRGLRAQDHNLQWKLVVDQVSTTLRLTDLLRRKFHPTRVRASGVEFALRQRLFRPEVTKESLYGLPPIEGYGAIPYKDEQPDEVITDDHYQLWSVHLEDVEARGVRLVWFDRARFEGDASASGGLFLKPNRRVQVDAQLQVQKFALHLGADQALADLRGHAALSMLPFDPRLVPGIRSKLRELDVRARFQAGITGLEFLQRLFGGQAEIAGGVGPLKMEVTIDRGIFVEGLVEATLAKLRVAGKGLRGSGDARVALRAERDQARPLTRATVQLDSLSLAPEGTSLPPLQVGHALLAAGVDRLDVLGTPVPRTVALDIEGAVVPDLRLAQQLLPPGGDLRILGGRGELDGHLEGTLSGTHGKLNVSVRRALVGGKEITLRGDVRGVVLLAGRGSAFHDLQLDGTHLEVEHVDVPRGNTSSGPGWWGQFTIPQGKLDTSARKLEVELSSRCRDARPIIGLFTSIGKLPHLVAGIVHLDGLRAHASLHAAPGEIALHDLRVTGSDAEVRANYRWLGKEKRGQALLKFHSVGVGLDLHPGGTSVILLHPTDWYLGRLKQESILAELRQKLPLGPAARSAAKPPR